MAGANGMVAKAPPKVVAGGGGVGAVSDARSCA
jgi:hypothetical protein